MLNRVEFKYDENYTKPSIRRSSTVLITAAHLLEDDYFSRPFLDGLSLEKARVVELEDMGARWRMVYRVKLDVSFEYTPGDSIGLYCPNDDSLVDEIMQILEIGDTRCKIESTGAVAFTYVGTLRGFFKFHYDFTTLPRKSFLMGLSLSCTDDNRERIEYLCSKEGRRDYLRMSKNWNSVIDIIRTFGSRPSLHDLLCDCELIKPRSFSLINEVGGESEILLGITEKVLEDSKRYGHVSSYVTNGKMEDIGVYLKPSKSFSLSGDKKILAVCTGTGVAPVLSFMNNLRKGQSLWIIYGFRSSEDDLIKSPSAEVRVTKVRSDEGVYVQDYLRNNMDEVRGYIASECSVYICGRIVMQKSVFSLMVREFGLDQNKINMENWL
jgi:methionine synthase reductase